MYETVVPLVFCCEQLLQQLLLMSPDPAVRTHSSPNSAQMQALFPLSRQRAETEGFQRSQGMFCVATVGIDYHVHV